MSNSKASSQIRSYAMLRNGFLDSKAMIATVRSSSKSQSNFFLKLLASQ